MKGKRWLHAVVVSIVAVFGALAIACSDSNDNGNNDNKPFESPAIGVYYYDAGSTEYLLSLNADKTLALTIDGVAISGNYDVNDSGAVTFSVSGADKLLNSAKYADNAVTLTYDGGVYKFLRNVNYTVTFNTGSGSTVDSATVRNGKKVTKPADPEYAGHVFIGWYKDSAATDAYKFASDVVKGNMTLYAGWVVKADRDEYQVKFDLGYGDNSLYYTATTVNGKVYAPELVEPTRAEYAFKGWWIKDAASGEYATRVDLGSYVFAQNETVYALWQGAAEGGKLDAPVVSIDLANNRLTWDVVNGAGSYFVKVVDPDGNAWTQSVSGTSVEYANKFTKAGTYTVEVYAVSLASADKNSATSTRKIVNKQLARVSNFNVTGDVLTFSGVENATKYLLYIACDDENHDHNPIDNGNSKEYNFGDCAMPDDGIKFVVEAQADGYVSSRSEEYTVARKLDKATGFVYDESTQTVSWSAVANAASYFVTVKCDNPRHEIETEVKNATSINIGECAVGSVKVTVVAKNVKKYIASDGAEYTVNKTEWAAVTGLALDDTTLTWKKQSRVKKYIVDVNGVTSEVTGDNKIDLSKLANLTLEVGKTYNIKVRAELNSGELTSWSLPYSAAYKTMTELQYSEGKVSWTPVFGNGSAGYKVVVNDAAPVSVNATEYKVTLTDKTNVIKVYIGSEDVSTAKSVTVNAFKLTFDGNGGTGAPDARYYANGDPIALPTGSVITRRGYNLMGWYTAAEGNSAAYYDGDLYDLTKDLTLYARWDGKEYTVSLNYNRTGDNTDEVTTVKVKYGSEYKLDVPTVPKSTIYGFMGWNRDRNGNGVVLTGADGVGLYSWDIAENNLTIYAVWETIFEFEKSADGLSYIIRKSGFAINDLSEIVIPAEYSEEGDMRTYPVASVGGNAFVSCNNLTKITIPSTVTTIEATAFNYCDNLQRIEISGGQEGVTRYWSVDGVLYGIDPITERRQLEYYPHGRTGDYTLDDGIDYLPYDAFKGANIDTLTIPSTVTYVANNAFGSSIQEIVFAEPKNNDGEVKALNIASGAFKGMSGLNSITLPSRTFNFVDEGGNVLANVDYKADLFNGCNSLASVNVAIGNAEYVGIDGMLCKKENGGADITVVFVPSGYEFDNGTYETNNQITAIGYGAFSALPNLRKITIGVSVHTIGEHAFSGYATTVNEKTVNIGASSNLTDVIIKGGRGAGLKIGRAAFGSDLSTDRVGVGTTTVYVACVNLYTLELESGCNITQIGNYAFAYTRLFEVELPTSLTQIGYGAFKNCSELHEVAIGGNDAGLSVANVLGTDQDEQQKEGVFLDCTNLQTVKLPKNITEFKGGVFAGCTSLTNIEVDPANKVLEFIDGILYGKNAETGKITAIHYIPANVNMKEYTIPDGITEISAGIFGTAGSSIEKLIINKYVTYIGKGAFASTDSKNPLAIKEVIFRDKSDDLGEPDEEEGGATSLTIEDGTKNTEGLFYNCKQLSNVTLPARLTTIADYMFYNCSKITSFDFTGIKEIGIQAFCGSGLTGELTISKTVEQIRMKAFDSLTKITKVTFEDGRTTELELLNKNGKRDGLDANNNFLSGQDSATNNPSATFYSCSGITEVHLPEGLVNLGGNMFNSCTKLAKINIPSTVRSIRYTTFAGCRAMETFTFNTRTEADELYLEDGSSQSDGVFSDFVLLTSFDFPIGTVRIPNYCFDEWVSGSYGAKNNIKNNLTRVSIPSTVRNLVNQKGQTAVLAIGTSAFGNSCTKLDTVTIAPTSAADLADANYKGFSIGSEAFNGCTKLTSITLPAGLCDYYSGSGTYSAFSTFMDKCPANMTDINVTDGGKYSSVDGMITNAAKTEILRCPKGKKSVTIPYSITKIGKEAFSGNSSLTSLTFAGKPAEATAAEGDVSDGLVIDEKAFINCTGLKNTLTISNRVTEIGVNAFNGCSGITSIEFESGSRLTSIGESAFGGCTELQGTLIIPASVTTIGERAFAPGSDGALVGMLAKLTGVQFGKEGETSMLTSIGRRAFAKSGLTSVYLPDSVTTLGDEVFVDCTGMISASVPLTVNNLNGMFSNCTSLTSLTLREIAGKDPVLNKEADGAVYSSDSKYLYYYPQSTVPNKGTADEGKLVLADGLEVVSAMTFVYNTSITEVVIPNTVTKIDSSAFYFMPSLKKVTFMDDGNGTAATSLEIGNNAFAGCNNLTEVVLPKRLSKLGVGVFDYCTNLTTVTFDANCALTEIPENAFRYADSLSSITFPSNVTKLGKYAFYGSGLTSVTIPIKVTSKEDYVFSDCKDLETVVFAQPSSNRSSFTIGKYMFENCTSLTSVTLSKDVKTIDNYAFGGCTALTQITYQGATTTDNKLPDTTTTLNQGAFVNCTNLTSLDLNKVSTLTAGSLAGAGLKKIKVPTTVTSTSFNNFMSNNGDGNRSGKCTSIEEIDFRGTKFTSLPSGLFKDMTSLKTVYLPDGHTGTNGLDIGPSVFCNTGLTSITIPTTTKTIGNDVFKNCSKLETVTFAKDSSGNSKLTSIGNSAFAGTKISSITIPKSVVMNNSSVFEDCTSLKTVVFESTASQGGSNSSLFRGCSALESVTLPTGLTSIDTNMFRDCSKLAQIAIPSTVRKIGSNAFYNCKALTSIDLSGALVTEIESFAFAQSGLKTAVASTGLQTIGNNAFYYCAELTSFTYNGTAVRTIGNSAFSGCKKLTAIVIPEGVTSIGNYAYENCDAVTTVTLPHSLTTLGYNPFADCDSLTEIVAPTYEEDEIVYFAVVGKALYGNKAVLDGQTVTLPQPAVLYTFFDRTATSFTVPDGIVGINNYAFTGLSNLTTLNADNDLSAFAAFGVQGLIIGENAFSYCGLTSVTLGEKVTLMYSAFNHCEALESITIPNGATLDLQVFDNCVSLTSVTVGENVTYGGYAATFGENAVLTLTGAEVAGIEGLVIKAEAFKNDTSLVNIAIAEGVTEIRNEAFSGAKNLANVVLPSTLKKIGNSAFANTGLTSITLPAGLESIGDSAFANVGLTSLTLPDNLKTIGDYAFMGTKNSVNTLTLPTGLKSIGKGAFAGLKITSITIPNTVETMSAEVFAYTTGGKTTACSNLSSIEFEEGNTNLTNIPASAFKNLASLTSVKLPDSLESIGSDAFVGTSLGSISIPATVTELSSGVFDGVSTLTSVTFKKDESGNSALATIGSNAFRGTGISGELKIPASVTVISSNAFYGCNGITSLVFEHDDQGESQLDRIDTGAFYGAGITEVAIPASVDNLGNYGSTATTNGAFDNCVSLAKVTFLYKDGKSALRSIGFNAFKGTAITEMVIPENVTTVRAAFVGCNQLTKVTLPKDLDSLATDAFANLPALTQLIIPEGVTLLSSKSLANITNVTTLVVPSTVTKIWGGVFNGWTADQTIYMTGIAAPTSDFNIEWARGCKANIVWNYQPETEPVED